MDNRCIDIDGWMADSELQWLWNVGIKLPEGSLGIELGAWFGKSTSALMLSAGLCKTIVTVDTWLGTDSEPDHDIAKSEDIQQKFLDNMASLNIPIREYDISFSGPQYIKSDSIMAAEKFEDNSVDFLFVDDDHRRPGAAIDAWLPKMKSPSIVAGHDYFCFYEYIQPQVHDRLGYINEIHHSIWVRYWNAQKPSWY
jgi:hypothetical protein